MRDPMSDQIIHNRLRLDGHEAISIVSYFVGVDGAHLALVEIDGDSEYDDGLGSLRLAVETSRLAVSA